MEHQEKYTRMRDIPKFTTDGSWQCDCTLGYLVEFIEEQKEHAGLNMEPDFQRAHVWTEEQQVKWLEYFLRGGKSGLVIYLNCPSWNNPVPDGAYNDFVCVDGLQRYTAVYRFVNNEIKVFGSFFKEYEDRNRFQRSTIKVNINDLKTREEVLKWYLDMNTGGTQHTEEEIGKVRMLLEEEHRLCAEKCSECVPEEAPELKYSVVGYDKDHDVSVCYGVFHSTEDAIRKAKELKNELDCGRLKRQCSDGSSEPIDWINVYKNWGQEDETPVWHSYCVHEISLSKKSLFKKNHV